MKWLKLDCDFRYDPKILSLIQQFGGKEAISFWVLLLSYMGANGMPECEIHVAENGAHSPNLLASFLCTKPKVALTMLSACAQVGLIQRERWENDSVIAIPKMLKRMDDYTRKVRTRSEQCPEKPAVEQNKKKNIHTVGLSADAFERLWAQYPFKDGRKEAEKHFKASVKTETDLADITKALANYLEHLRRESWKKPKNGSTWFNNWRDWLHNTGPEKLGPPDKPVPVC